MKDNEIIGDLKISGSGSSVGGSYKDVSISGSGKITGDLQCESFKISGSGKVDGAITTNEFKISGSGKVTKDLKCSNGVISGSGAVQGSVVAEKFKISGSGKIQGNFSGEYLTVSGTSTICGKINATNVDVSGVIKGTKGVDGELININGSIITQGMINGDEVNIGLNGNCEVSEIGASKVRVCEYVNMINSIFNKMNRIIVGLFIKDYGYLKVKTIEADEIYLENTIADVVRGEKITIGRGCSIKLIEYKNNLEKIDSNSTIEEERKI